MNAIRKQYSLSEYPTIIKEFLKWLVLSVVIGTLVGVASAALLASLNWSTNYREANKVIIWLLPVGGLFVGLLYHYYGQSVAKGNNQLLEELNTPKDIIPFKMAPFIFIGTVVSHLFGASVGREGTAVQIGGAIADQFSGWLKMNKSNRRIIILMGISSGFAGLFGTPLAGAVFALEVLLIGKIKYNAILPCLLVAVVANFASREVAHYLHVPHTNYVINLVPKLSISTFFWCVLAGIIFGIVSTFFSKGVHFFSQFSKLIKYPPLRPVVGGTAIAVLVYFIGTKYIGLGIPTILDSFVTSMHSYDFAIKLILTTFCIAFGFKGGEVTPLFFIGATLGSALAFFFPLPIGLLAGMGFVAVFSGATNTPIACTLMGIELFGMDSGVYIAIACVTAYVFSGHTGIYTSQIVGTSKTDKYTTEEGNTLGKIDRK
ncbi:voltage-gated chloride channel family protein [Wenyingzhuangia aestuarii]|uniref:voltage-gated chloride channel family protein n=1 Tax=Wenyingzhuangia aestuarii TaxID=1647582 RepID=UPI00143CB747|nr:voltage-gated chloride channel family protein [Wenyingzhuangia aestuarii]NJB82144.1 H+/Cl- antiporter ClcA [Wenyingzhuangia aestuarii]